MKTHFLIYVLTALFCINSQNATAQQGFGTSQPDKSSVVDMESNRRGLLIPRLSLTKTTVATPVVEPAQSLMVYNVATTNDVVPGYYFWNNDRWERFVVQEDIEALDISGDVIGGLGTTKVVAIQGVNVSEIKPTIEGQALIFNGTEWEAGIVEVEKKPLTTDGIIVIGDSDSDLRTSESTLLSATNLSIKNESITTTQIKDGTIELIDLAEGDGNTILGTDEAGELGWYPKRQFTGNWMVQDSSYYATNSNQDIVHYGGVAIGGYKSGKGVKLDVFGSFRAGHSEVGSEEVGTNSISLGDLSAATHINSIAIGKGASARNWESIAIGGGVNGYASGSSSISIGQSSRSVGFYSISIGNDVESLGDMSMAMGVGTIASTIEETVMGRYNAIRTGDSSAFPVGTDALFQIGNGTDKESGVNNALTILKNGKVGIGIDGAEDAAKPTEILDIGKGNVRIRDLYENISIDENDALVVVDSTGVLKILPDNSEEDPEEGPEMFKMLSRFMNKSKKSNNLSVIEGLKDSNSEEYNGDNGVGNYRMVVADEHGTLKQIKASMPKFFSPPAMIFPTNTAQIVDRQFVDEINGTFTVDLYKAYSNQFGLTNKARSASNSSRTTSLPILPADELDYYITDFDNNVFSNVSVSDDGKLTYNISESIDTISGSSMTILFVVKP